jgi:hypothetical protein
MRTSKYTRTLSVALPPEHFEMIERITDEKQISKAEWVRNAVAAALTENQQKEETM